MIEQGLLFKEAEDSSWKVKDFSADHICQESARKELEDRYWGITEVTEKFSRQSVSYQLSKKDRIHRWLKYKEGFSSDLVRTLLDDFHVTAGDTIMDPFMGSGTTALVAKMAGINSVGFDILPISKVSILSKSNVFDYDIEELNALLEDIRRLETPQGYSNVTRFVSTTEDGYPEQTARDLAYFEEHFNASNYSDEAKLLLKLCTLNTLESIGYSKKDGQYLRWDVRCPKIIRATEERLAKGKKPFVVQLNKGVLPTLKEALLEEFSQIVEDITNIQQSGRPAISECRYIEGSALYELPRIDPDSISAVISSPPYCNRYDYTRTYAMELAYLGADDAEIKRLRQALLSCTVESKSKIQVLSDFYTSIDRQHDFDTVMQVINTNSVLNEIISALKIRLDMGEINNKGVIPMVQGYFTELAFVFFELYRVCRNGAHVAFVNDNVRYAGEVVPVDYLTTMLAESFGFIPETVYTLKQQKGNSSQQMKKYGKVSLRKSITIWRK